MLSEHDIRYIVHACLECGRDFHTDAHIIPSGCSICGGARFVSGPVKIITAADHCEAEEIVAGWYPIHPAAATELAASKANRREQETPTVKRGGVPDAGEVVDGWWP